MQTVIVAVLSAHCHWNVFQFHLVEKYNDCRLMTGGNSGRERRAETLILPISALPPPILPCHCVLMFFKSEWLSNAVGTFMSAIGSQDVYQCHI